jgi:hypothetical protein
MLECGVKGITLEELLWLGVVDLAELGCWVGEMGRRKSRYLQDRLLLVELGCHHDSRLPGGHSELFSTVPHGGNAVSERCLFSLEEGFQDHLVSLGSGLVRACRWVSAAMVVGKQDQASGSAFWAARPQRSVCGWLAWKGARRWLAKCSPSSCAASRKRTWAFYTKTNHLASREEGKHPHQTKSKVTRSRAFIS